MQLDANLGVSTDNQTTPPLPMYLPPVLIFLPWVLRACSLPPDYLPGRIVAIQLLCEMNIHHVRTQPSLQQLTLFYQLLQRSLQPTSVSTHSLSPALHSFILFDCLLPVGHLEYCSEILQ